MKLKGVWDEPKGGSPFAHITISTTLFDKFTPRPRDEMVLANTPGGVTDANTAHLEHAVKGFADAKVQTRDEFKSNFEAPINKLLNLLYALLALSVIVSLVGIINTLVLTVFERTREIGMLRAVGMTRRQVRMMIRYESIVTALMGAALGMVVGVFLAAARHACALELRDRLRGALDRARLLRDRGDPGRHPRRGDPGPAGRSPERPAGAPVRVVIAVRRPLHRLRPCAGCDRSAKRSATSAATGSTRRRCGSSGWRRSRAAPRFRVTGEELRRLFEVRLDAREAELAA